MGIVSQDCDVRYADLVRGSRLIPLDGHSGVYVGDVAILYKPREKTDGLIFVDPTKSPQIYAVRLTFPQIAELYSLFSRESRIGIVRAVRLARGIATEVCMQNPESLRIATEHEGFLENNQEMFYDMLTPDERVMLDKQK